MFSFVILHYNNIEETLNCVNSILKNVKNRNYKIVIVDNGSSNNTGETLNSMFIDNEDIKVIISDKNLGFSGGNNIGFRYAKQINSDFIVMINNDTLIEQSNFLDLIEDKYENNKFAVLGPKIILPDGRINPITKNMRTINQVKNSIRYNKRLILINKLHLNNIYDILKKLKKDRKKPIILTDSEMENVILHGCCWIFSPIFIKEFDGIDEKTFLYCEEEFLYLKLKKNNMHNIYYPKLEIYHMEHASTKKAEKTIRKSMINRYKNLIKANEILLKTMSEMEEH